jgi:hypothetical protein
MPYRLNPFTGQFDYYQNTTGLLTKAQADTYYYPLSTNPAGYLTAATAPSYWDRTITGATAYLQPHTTTDRIILGGATDDGTTILQANGYVKIVDGTQGANKVFTSDANGLGSWETLSIPSVGTWGALNYPTWSSGTPFVKMTATGTFALDTNTYVTGTPWTGLGYITLASLSATSPISYNNSTGAISITPSTNLASLQALSYSSASFVKMTGANTFALDTNTYLSANPFGAFFGGGIDGTGTYNGGGTTTLQRSYYHTNATLSSNTSINTNGWYLCGNGTLTINSGCTVHWNGTDGNNAVGASGASAPSSVVGRMAPAGVGQYSSSTGGASGSSSAGGSSSSSQGGSGMCGAGGNGGNGGAGSYGGGTGAAAGSVTFTPLDIMSLSLFTYDYYGASFTTIGSGSGGSGGGGGGGSGTQSGGGGGSGGLPGGFCVICFPTIVNAGTISAKGGKGGNGYQGTTSNCGGGGSGGGGSGGVVWMIYLTYSGAGTISAAGGIVGTPGNGGGGTGQIGSTGGTGAAGYIRRFNLTTGVVSTS